jgi:acyl-CoA carboxylase epsilon subunit
VSDDESGRRPALRIVNGSPTPEELAALTAIVTAASGSEPRPVETGRRGGWNDPAARRRPALIPGPNGWRASAR